MRSAEIWVGIWFFNVAEINELCLMRPTMINGVVILLSVLSLSLYLAADNICRRVLL